MKNNHIVWFGRYEGYLRMIARGVSEKNTDAIESAAKIFDLMLPKNAIVVPMPGHLGYADSMFSVASEIKKRRSDIKVWNHLYCLPHVSNRSQKEYTTPDIVRMFTSGGDDITDSDKVFIIDNVVCTGVTACAASKELPNATVVALAMSNWR